MRWLSGLLLLALLAPVRGSGGPYEDWRAARDGIQRVLDGQADAVLARDRGRYLAAVDPEAGGYHAAQRRVFGNLGRLPLAHWAYEIEELRLRGAHAEADVRLRYGMRRYDRVPVTATEKLAFTRRDGRWYVAAERPGSGRQLWEQGRMSVLRGKHSLVLSAGTDAGAGTDTGTDKGAGKSTGGAGTDEAMLREVSAAADRAVPAVSLSWPREWSRRVVIEVPGSARGMGELLGAPAQSYDGIAAVTTGSGGGAEGASADRIVVNPEAYGVLTETGRQVVLTHETVHVATRAHTTAATPLWLSEGLADWVGWRGTGRPVRSAAPQLTRAVREGTPPGGLPTDREFRFGAAADALSRAYEGGWLACRMIADRWGEERLMAFYLKVGERRSGKDGQDGQDGSSGTDGDHRPGVDAALRDVLGVDRAEFTARWRDYVRDELG